MKLLIYYEAYDKLVLFKHDGTANYIFDPPSDAWYFTVDLNEIIEFGWEVIGEF